MGFAESGLEVSQPPIHPENPGKGKGFANSIAHDAVRLSATLLRIPGIIAFHPALPDHPPHMLIQRHERQGGMAKYRRDIFKPSHRAPLLWRRRDIFAPDDATAKANAESFYRTHAFERHFD
jgi:hypothetical protein